MNHPNGLEYTMDMKVSMGPVTLTNSKLVAYKAGLKKKIIKANEDLAKLEYKFKC